MKIALTLEIRTPTELGSVRAESRLPEPHRKFTTFFLLQTDHYKLIVYITNIYNNKNLDLTVKSGTILLRLRTEIKIKMILGLVFCLTITWNCLPFKP